MAAELWLLFVLLGAMAGVLAGMLGVGGGLIIVPVLLWGFEASEFQTPDLMQLAVGTSLATIIFTSLSSVRAHHRRGAVDWRMVGRFTPGIVIGVGLCSLWVDEIASGHLELFFALFELAVALQMMGLALRAPATRQLPTWPMVSLAGVVIGAVSTLVGVGGGTMTVPYLAWHKVAMARAVAISSAVGFPIAVAGTLGYLLAGWDEQQLPAYSLGYIYLPALLAIVTTSVLFAPLGAWLAHRLPAATLKRLFGLLLLLIALRMLWP